jgi:hypothetical protein
MAKLEWSRFGDSALQRRDVIQLLERTWERLDHAYVQRWISELGLESEWREACERVTGPPASDEEVTQETGCKSNVS